MAREEKKSEHDDKDEKKESKGTRRYGRAPHISPKKAKAEPKGRASEGTETTKEEHEEDKGPKAGVGAGTDGIHVTERHAADREGLHHRHAREISELHHKHQGEHRTHKGDKAELHARHHKERKELHAQHEREMKEMHVSHEKEPKAGMSEETAEAGGTTDAGVGAGAEAA